MGKRLIRPFALAIRDCYDTLTQTTGEKIMQPQIELAQRFSELLKRVIGPSIADVISRNALEENCDVCHSHDFCDANEVMLQAWKDCGHDPDDITGEDHADEARRLWQTSWDIAKEYDFDPDDYAESDYEELIREAKRWS